MIEEILDKFIASNKRKVHIWKLKKNAILEPLSEGEETSIMFESRKCYLIGRYFKAESYEYARSLSKLKLHIWIGCQCTYYMSLFSPILQYCRSFSQAVEVFADFQFNESPDLLSLLSVKLITPEEKFFVHPIIQYSFTGKEELPEYFLIVSSLGEPSDLRHFTSITKVPVCTKEPFPECTFVHVKKGLSGFQLKAFLGNQTPSLHGLVLNWIKELIGGELETTTMDTMNDDWRENFAKGGYEYLADNFWRLEEEKTSNMKDFPDMMVKKAGNKTLPETPGIECYRIFFENHNETIKGKIEEEMRSQKVWMHKTPKFISDWNLHFKQMILKKAKYMDSKEILLFNLQKYLLKNAKFIPL